MYDVMCGRRCWRTGRYRERVSGWLDARGAGQGDEDDLRGSIRGGAGAVVRGGSGTPASVGYW